MPEPGATRPGELFSLRDTVAVVTGAARGIGKAAALALAAHGARVVLVDRLETELATTADELDRSGAWARAVIADVTDDTINDRVQAAIGDLDTPTVLINAAGIMIRTGLTELTAADLEALWRVNVRGTVAVTQSLLPRMIARGYGKIVNVGSLGSVRGLERRTGYAATKGAVAQYTMSVAAEAGAHGVRANLIAPGYVATDMASPWMYGDAERTERLLARIPLGHFAAPGDLAGTFVFLAAPASDYITGQTVLVDGGWTIT